MFLSSKARTVYLNQSDPYIYKLLYILPILEKGALMVKDQKT